MAFGLLVSALCDNEQDAIQLALGSFYPNLLLSGIIWPLEGMPDYLRLVTTLNNRDLELDSIMSQSWTNSGNFGFFFNVRTLFKNHPFL